jgi:hypothetical protein
MRKAMSLLRQQSNFKKHSLQLPGGNGSVADSEEIAALYVADLNPLLLAGWRACQWIDWRHMHWLRSPANVIAYIACIF